MVYRYLFTKKGHAETLTSGVLITVESNSRHQETEELAQSLANLIEGLANLSEMKEIMIERSEIVEIKGHETIKE